MSDMAATRDGYGQALLEMAGDEKVVVLEADLGKSTKSVLFRKAHPERTISCGIGEQNMMLIGAGLASSGYKPFASTFAIFTERGFEQVRNGIARPNLAVHICGSHGGTHTGTDGGSAQSIEDLAIYRTLPNMTVMHPSDYISAMSLTKQCLGLSGPSYMRTARNKTIKLYSDEAEITIGKANIIRHGGAVAIIACGVLVGESLEAADALAAEGIEAMVIDMHTLKPLDNDAINRAVDNCGCLVTAEDHSVIGGLGGAVAEYICANQPVPLEMVGVKDRFGESAQSDEMLEMMGLTSKHIAAAARRAIQRKENNR
jgi:transketolase